MKTDLALLLTLADDAQTISARIRAAVEPDGQIGKKVSLAELASILAAVGKLAAHVAGMIASGKHA